MTPLPVPTSAKLAGGANLPFLLLQLPQIILNSRNLLASNKAALFGSKVYFMGGAGVTEGVGDSWREQAAREEVGEWQWQQHGGDVGL